MVLALGVKAGTGLLGTLLAVTPSVKGFKEIREGLSVGLFVGRASGKLKACIPVRRRLEVRTWSVGLTQPVIGGALFGIAENFVGFTDVLEFRLGPVFLIEVRMILAGKFAVGALDFILCRSFFDTQQRLIVLVFHDVVIPNTA